MVDGEDVCWICGKWPLTNEHLIKRSDLAKDMTAISPEQPAYIYRDISSRSYAYRPLRVNGLRRQEFSAKVICGQCNNTVSQPYDKAWDEFSDYLRYALSHNIEVRRLRGSRAYKYNARARMLDMHLYFAKNLGCYLKLAGVGFNFDGLAKAILTRECDPHLYLTFGKFNEVVTGISDIHVLHDTEFNDEVVAACYFYETGGFAVRVEYLPDHVSDRILWNPKRSGTSLLLLGFDMPEGQVEIIS